MRGDASLRRPRCSSCAARSGRQRASPERLRARTSRTAVIVPRCRGPTSIVPCCRALPINTEPDAIRCCCGPRSSAVCQPSLTIGAVAGPDDPPAAKVDDLRGARSTLPAAGTAVQLWQKLPGERGFSKVATGEHGRDRQLVDHARGGHGDDEPRLVRDRRRAAQPTSTSRSCAAVTLRRLRAGHGDAAGHGHAIARRPRVLSSGSSERVASRSADARLGRALSASALRYPAPPQVRATVRAVLPADARTCLVLAPVTRSCPALTADRSSGAPSGHRLPSARYRSTSRSRHVTLLHRTAERHPRHRRLRRA